jgi:YD repeat-containing protein
MKKIHAILLDGETPLTDTSLLVQARYSANIGKDGGEVNGKVGKLNVKIKFPKDALAEDAEISMQVPEQLPASLPYKGGHPMELIAIGKSNNNRIHQFNNSIEVQISYDPSEIGIHPSTLALYWFDEATGTWRVVPSYTDEEKNILYGLTDHFSLFSTGQNSWESMKIPPIDGELVSTFVGSASYSIPIEVPAGPGGIAPSISLNYDSMSVEGITNQKSTSGGTSGTSDGTQTSWVGAGWSLASGGYIMRNMGENVDWSGDDTFSLVVGGNSFRLVPVSHTADYSYIDYKPTDENFWLIRRYKSQGTQSYQKITTDAYGNKVVTSASASSEDDQWVAWDKAGVRYKFGYRQDRQTRAYYVETYRDNAAPPAQLCILATNRVCIFRPWGWFLEEIKYPSGQTLTFTYTKDQDNKCYGDWVKVGSVDTCSFYAYADQATYPAEIQYPDQKTKIIFNPDANNREDYLWHYGDFGTKIRYEKKRLQSIQVKVDGITIREYKLDYYLTGEVPIFPESKWTPKDPLTNNNIKDDKRMSVLKTVTQYGLGGITGGGPTLQPITFKYGQFNLNNVNYNVGDQMHLSQVSNGQGGTVYFVYEDNDGNDNKPWAATDGGTTQRITKSSQFVLHSGEEQIINQFDADNNEKFLPVMPGIRYRFGCTVVGQHAAGTTVEFKLLSRANDEGTYSGTSVDASNSSTNDKAISGYVDLPMNANRATPKVQLDAGSIATLKGCNVVPLTTHYRVQKRIVTDSASKPGQIISYPFTYEYTGAAVNDTVHSTYAGLDVTVRSGGSEPNTEFRGHSKVTMTDPYNLKTETYFYQDDVRKGKVSDVKKYDISQGNLLLSWSKTNWPTPGVDQTVPVDTDTKVCARRDVYASCFQDQKVIWETSDWEEYRDYGAGATSEASTNFVGTRTEYYYAPKEAGGWGNLVGILERSWNGTQWIAYRLTRTSYLSQSQGSYNDGGANIDTTKNWTGLPASTNVYLCPAGSADCSFTKQGSVWTYPPIENLVNSSCNLYETPTDQGSGTATCSILKSGSATVENLDTLNSATLTGKRTLLHFGDGATANYSDPHYSDELYVFDSWGNRTKRITNPKEGTASGRADKVYSSDNQVTTWDYDNSAFAARVTKETNPLSQITQYSYDDIIPTGGTVPVPMGGYYLGLPTMETDANSASAYAQYDAFGRMTALILPGDTSASPTIKAAYHEFDPNTNTPAWIEVSQKDRFGQYTSNIRKIFNGLARLIQTQTGGATVQGSPRDIITQTEYDAYGRTTKQSTPIDLAVWDGSGNPYREQAFAADHSNFTETAYDAAGRVKTATASDLTTTSSAYSIGTLPTQGNLLLTTVTDARNNATMNYKDAFGHLMYVDASTGPDVSYTYTVTDLLTAATYGVATTNLTYDLAGRKTSLTDPDMGSWTYQYDALGNLKTQADTRGCSTALTYDRLNRLTGKAFANCSGTNPAISFTYDASSATNSGKSRRTGMTDASGTTTWEYDMRGRVTHESRHILDQLDGNRDLGTYHTYWSYNTDNSVRQMIYPNGETVDFAYHPQGAINQVSSIQDASDITQSYVTATSYDAAGRVTNRSLGNGINQTYTYYPWNQQGGRLNVILAQKSGLPDYQNTTLTYDPVGNIHTLLDSAANEPLTTFTYDSLNRLDLVTGAYSEDPVYDPSTGNISSRNNITYTYGDTAHKHAVTTTSDGRAFGYDANGNMTTRNIPGGSYNLGYDAENRLTTINDLVGEPS